MPAIRRISILRTQSASSGIFIYHRVHATWCNTEEKAWLSQLLEVAVVTMPIRLRNDGNTISSCFQCASDYGCSERGMINLCNYTKKDDIYTIPFSEF